MAVEVKNVRPWIYPRDDGLMAFLVKCCELDAVPLLIARRIPFVTFKVFHTCGVLFHQTYNQRFPETARDAAALAARKDLLGYHDIRVGNEPDARLTTFMTTLPRLIVPARAKFDEFKDLLCAFATKEMPYSEFAARVRRRAAGTSEDSDE